MAVEFLFGILLLGIVVFVIFRIIGSVALGALLAVLVFIASYLMVGSFPSLGEVPLIGKFIPKTGEAVAIIKNVFHRIEILSVSRGSDQNLLVTVVNSGRLDLSNFTAFVDGNQVAILNNIGTLKSGGVMVFELDWKDNFTTVAIKSDRAEDVYFAE